MTFDDIVRMLFELLEWIPQGMKIEIDIDLELM